MTKPDQNLPTFLMIKQIESAEFSSLKNIREQNSQSVELGHRLATTLGCLLNRNVDKKGTKYVHSAQLVAQLKLLFELEANNDPDNKHVQKFMEGIVRVNKDEIGEKNFEILMEFIKLLNFRFFVPSLLMFISQNELTTVTCLDDTGTKGTFKLEE